MGERERIVARIRAVRRKLKNTKSLMSRIGKILVSSSRDAFLYQELGNVKWARRYGGTMEPPFINIAGALADFIAGSPAPKKVQFLDQPALLTTGTLMRSVAARVGGDATITLYSPLPYARLHQEGGESIQTYGQDVKERIREWLYTKKGESRKNREGFEKHLSPLLKKDELRTEVQPRPFIGVTDEAEERIDAEIKKHFEGRA